MAQELKNLYLIYGDEQYLKEKKKNELLKALHAKNSVSFNAFSGRDIDLFEVARLADTMPFLEEYRKILLSDTGFFKGSAPKDILETAESLPESTVLLFYETEADTQNALYRFVKENGEVFRFQKAEGKSYKEASQDQTRIRSWGTDYLKKNNREIGGRAMTKLLQLTGYDMLNLQTELDKLIAYTVSEAELSEGLRRQSAEDGAKEGKSRKRCVRQDGGFSRSGDERNSGTGTGGSFGARLPVVEIREQDIEAICSKTVSDKVFDMLSAKLSGSISTALLLFEDLLALRVPPMRVLFLLSRQFNQVYLMKELSRERIGDGELAARLQIRDWQLRKLKEQSAKLRISDAKRYLELCVEMETRIKLGDMNEKLGVEIVLAS